MEQLKVDLQTAPKFFRFWFFHVNDVDKFEGAFFNGIVQEILENDDLTLGKSILKSGGEGKAVIHELIGEFERYKKKFIVRIFYFPPKLVFAYMENNDEFMMDALMGGIVLDHGISIDRNVLDMSKIKDVRKSSMIIRGAIPDPGEKMPEVIDDEWVETMLDYNSLNRKAITRIWKKGWIDVEMVPSDIVFHDRNHYLEFPIELLLRVVGKLSN